MKKIIFLILTTVLLFTTTNVKALDMGYPTQTYKYISPEKQTSGTPGLQVWWDEEYYALTGYLGNPGSTSAIGSEFINNWPTANLCVGQSILITGYVGGLFGFYDESYTFKAYNAGSEMTCSTELIDSSKLKYTCSGVGGGAFTISVKQNSFRSGYSYQMGVSRIVNVSCDNTNSDIITNNNNNTNNIINNQNNNTNTIINNNNANTDKVVGSLTDNTIPSVESTNDYIKGISGVNIDDNFLLQLMVIPFNFLKSIYDSFNNTCSPYSFGSFFGTELKLPCINLKETLGNELYTIVDVLIAGTIALAFINHLKSMFDDILELSDRAISKTGIEIFK